MPSNDSEQRLYNIAKELLETDNFGVTDDLTLIGLSSLLAIKMCFLAEKAGLTLNVNSVLKHKTIRLILTQETSIGSWENEYDSTKPVAVLIQGLTSYSQLEALKDSLCTRYSVMFIGPIE
jgi:surfactin family lipopeptide synthetase A